MGTDHNSKNLLVIMSKFPQPGHTKTRLEEQVSPINAANIARAMLLDLVSVHIEQSYHMEIRIPQKDTKHLNDFRKLVPGVPIRIGRSNNLRGTMSQLLEAFTVNSKRFHKVIVIYADVPFLLPNIIEEAFDKLNHCDIVIGPDNGGGYYLIGMTEAYDLFTDISEARLPYIRKTIEAAINYRLSHCLLDQLVDLDTASDISELTWPPFDSKTGWPRTREVLSELGLIDIEL